MMMALSDGSILVQDGINPTTSAGKSTFRLSPQANTGSYVNGVWSAAGSMNENRLFFTTAMLPDGRIFAVGGEYPSFSNTAEIYNPVTDTWAYVDSAPTADSKFGDDPIEVLSTGPNKGQVLAGYYNSTTTYRFNPAAAPGSQWTATAGGKLHGDRSDEEAWVKLKDGSILSYDVFASGGGTFQAQRYVPATDTWVDASTLSGTNPPNILESNGAQGRELGPAFLQPDGNVIYFGANGNTAIYNPTTNIWTAGPAEPTKVIGGVTTNIVGTDDPGAMLPNGRILIALSPQGKLVNGNYNFPAPTFIYEYDPVTQTFTENTPGGLSGVNAFQLNMVVLPSGQVLLSNEGNPFQVYTEDPVTGPMDAWRPSIKGIADNHDGTFTLTGTQLNGISEGANYGDDNESASNYPIIQFTDSGGNISYGRTTNWSSAAVATGSTPVTTMFTLPTGHTSLNDFTSIVVIANGIPSLPAAPLALGTADENVTIRVDPNDSTMVQVLVTNTTTVVATHPNNTANPIIIVGDANNNTVTVDESNGVVNVPIGFDGGGSPGAPGDQMIVLGTSGNDALNLTPSGTTSADMTFDGSMVYSFSNIQQFSFNGEAGDDSMTVDSSISLLGLSNGIQYDGGTGSDKLILTQTGGNQTSDTYSPGPNPGQGTDVITGPSGTQTVSFQNLTPLLDTVPALSLTVNGTPANNAISYTVGSSLATGLVSVDNFEPIEFANKIDLLINSGLGTDTITLNNLNTPTGLSNISVTGGDPSANDSLIVTGVASTVTVDTFFASILGASGNGGAVPILYNAIGNLTVRAGGSTTLAVINSHKYVYTPGTAADAGTIQTDTLPISFTGFGAGSTLALSGLGVSTDSVVANGTPGNDTFTVAATTGSVTLGGRATITTASLPNLTLNGFGGNDLFILNAPLPYASVTVAGGGPGTTNLFGNGTSANVTLGPTAVVTGGGLGNVTVSGCAALNLAAGTGDLAVTGSVGPDAFKVDVDATDTISVTDGPAFTATNTGALNLAGASSSSANSLAVNTHSAAQVSYTPQSPNSGTIAVSSPVSRSIQLSGIETFTYDGTSGNAALTVQGTPSANNFTLTPGAANDAGTLSMDSTLPVSFQNLGASGQVVVNGNGGADSLVYNGTAASDSFTVASSALGGQVNLNARVPLLTANIQTLTLVGLTGSDTFTLTRTIAASPYTTLNLNGSSGTGDQANLTAATAADVTVSGQVVSQGSNTVVGTGLANINLDGAGNRLIYNGVAGVTENINVLASPTANNGQVSVPGEVLVTFVNVPTIAVNGNAADNDTLGFTGTSNTDKFLINLAAAGTLTDQVLQLQNPATGTTLLMLENYTGFSTLNIFGQNGADTFNVYTNTTAPGGGRQILIDAGLPSGKRKLTSVLNVFYVMPKPKIVHSISTQDHDAGLVSLKYAAATYLIQYDEIETVTIQKGSTPPLVAPSMVPAQVQQASGRSPSLEPVAASSDPTLVATQTGAAQSYFLNIGRTAVALSELDDYWLATGLDPLREIVGIDARQWIDWIADFKDRITE
jgi:hypothetical protein